MQMAVRQNSGKIPGQQSDGPLARQRWVSSRQTTLFDYTPDRCIRNSEERAVAVGCRTVAEKAERMVKAPPDQWSAVGER